MPPHIDVLIGKSDRYVASLLAKALRAKGLCCVVAHTLPDARRLFDLYRHDLVLVVVDECVSAAFVDTGDFMVAILADRGWRGRIVACIPSHAERALPQHDERVLAYTAPWSDQTTDALADYLVGLPPLGMSAAG